MLPSNTTTTTKSQVGESTTKGSQTSHYITKSKAATARWSGSDRKIAKARQQSLDKTRREKAAVQKAFDLGIVAEEDEAAEQVICWEAESDDGFAGDFDEPLWGLDGEEE